MHPFNYFRFLLFSLFLFFTPIASSKIVSDKVHIGAIISLTGDFSSEAIILKERYDKETQDINKQGGLSIGGKTYLFNVNYYDDESNLLRANNLIKRLINHEGFQYLIIPQTLEVSDSIKNLIKAENISIKASIHAIKDYKKAFETVNSVDNKRIKQFILNDD
jgi:ABC-type branched-subunit amino acid transport system substrate-binding protein